MKRTVWSLLMAFMALASFSQPSVLRITGQITDDSTGTPIPHHPVLIMADSGGANCPNGMVYSQTVMTNFNGIYLKQIPLWTTAPSTFIVSTKDCNNVVHAATVPAVAGTDTVNFSICGGFMPPPPPGCHAHFIYNPIPNVPGKIKFISKSTPLVAQHSWDLGDGSTSTLRHPMHTYAAPGVYNVCLIINTANNCADTFCMNVLVDSVNTPPPPPPCQANFLTKVFQNMPSKVKFISKSTPLAMMHSWDFGDGNTSNLRHPMHTYSAPGTYNVCLIISDNQGFCADTTCMSVIIDSTNTPPIPSCSADFITKSFPFMPGKIKFFSKSMPMFAQHSWDFGDGSTSNFKHPMHNYTAPGLYNVCLIIHAGNGACADTFCMNVQVDSFNIPTPIPCQANFTYFIDSITGAVHFSDQSTPLAHYSHWDFGDGTTGIGKNPVHTYLAPGSYTVSLAIGCMHPSNLCTDTTSQVIVIPSAKTALEGKMSLAQNLGNIGQVYPNPSNKDARIDIEIIRGGEVSIIVMDLSGKQVFESSNVFEPGTHTLVIPASRFSSGYYTLRLWHENGDTVIRKLSRIE